MPCINIEDCVFYKKIEKVNTQQSEFIRTHICFTDFMQCVRYKIMRQFGNSYVPPDLSPLSFDIASEIIRAAKKEKQLYKENPERQKPKKPNRFDFD